MRSVTITNPGNLVLCDREIIVDREYLERQHFKCAGVRSVHVFAVKPKKIPSVRCQKVLRLQMLGVIDGIAFHSFLRSAVFATGSGARS